MLLVISLVSKHTGCDGHLSLLLVTLAVSQSYHDEWFQGVRHNHELGRDTLT